MRVIVFGASGLVGHGALRACLLDDDVTEVLAVLRRPLPVSHPKLRQVVHEDFTDYSALQDRLTGLDACLFCLGTSSVGMDEAAYTRVTYDFALAAARALQAASPSLVFAYVSGAGTDPTGTSRQMWARVKGRTENELSALPLRTVMVRPGYIHPVGGAVPRSRALRALRPLTSALFPLLRRAFPGQVTTSDALGRAMLAAVRSGGTSGAVLDTPAINRLAA
ncbi:NAD(P)H-binding protein [Streptomyces sp. NPDC001941]|uniref:NAD(P)H-binding protein n=1 Tax=Streptomyces sp. NPDC001941 TaxID=3154659 RepID=UPI00331EC2E6